MRSLTTYTSSLFCLILLFLLSVSTTPAVVAQSTQEGPLDLDDLGDLVRLPHTPSISPDGSHVVLVTERTNYELNRYERFLELIDLETGEHRELTPERPRVGDPQWSPSGDRLAFLDADEEGPMQLHVLPMKGGEARQITSGDEGVRFYEWSPDGSSIVYGRMDEAEEKEGEERHNRSFEVGDNSYLTQSQPRPTHLYMIGADGGEPERLTEGPESVDEFAWAPDGRALALRVRPTPHTGAGIRATIQLLELESRERRVLTSARGLDHGLAFSPDGQLLAFLAPRDEVPWFYPNSVFVVPREGGEPRNVTPGIDRDLGFAVWLPDGRALLVRGVDVTRMRVWLQPLDGPARPLDLGPVDPTTDLSLSDEGRAAFVGLEPHRPFELYVIDSPEVSPQRVTNLNGAIASRQQGRTETITWQGPDGFELSGVLTYPPGYEAGREYPLVLVIHGGPMLTSMESFDPLIQIMAARGWLVFQPNYRGSNNQGLEFQRAVVNDAGDGLGRDVMSGVELLKSRGLIDESRIAVSGWSYGGFNDNAENYWRQSPIAYAHQIRTPTLILSTTGDKRVPISQSYKLYHALKDNEVEVQFIAYPVGGHFPGDPVHQRDVFRRWIDWIEEHFNRRANP